VTTVAGRAYYVVDPQRFLLSGAAERPEPEGTRVSLAYLEADAPIAPGYWWPVKPPERGC
jgi:hypothetical protein